MLQSIKAVSVADGYKYSQAYQYPEGTDLIYSYGEARGGPYDQMRVFGTELYVLRVLLTKITREDVNKAQEYVEAFGMVFNRKLWMKIVNRHKGMIPVTFYAVPDGTVMPVKMPVYAIEAKGEFHSIASFLESGALGSIWYPSTVATISWRIRNVIREFYDITGGVQEMIPFTLNDFGLRGAGCPEQAAIGGMAHLLSFEGTDNIPAFIAACEMFDAKLVPSGVCASEHSTMTFLGREGEFDRFEMMIDTFAHKGILAVVSDGYDYYNAVTEFWCSPRIVAKVKASGAKVVIRPDSGNPVDVVMWTLGKLADAYGYTVNDAGYWQIDASIGLIYGDGINEISIREILSAMEKDGWAASNIVFGMGGALLQAVNRDTMKWAQKTSYGSINGVGFGVSKDPITDPGKKSKTGRVTTMKLADGNFAVGDKNDIPEGAVDIMRPIYDNGILNNLQTFTEMRENAP